MLHSQVPECSWRFISQELGQSHRSVSSACRDARHATLPKEASSKRPSPPAVRPDGGALPAYLAAFRTGWPVRSRARAATLAHGAQPRSSRCPRSQRGKGAHAEDSPDLGLLLRLLPGRDCGLLRRSRREQRRRSDSEVEPNETYSPTSSLRSAEIGLLHPRADALPGLDAQRLGLMSCGRWQAGTNEDVCGAWDCY